MEEQSKKHNIKVPRSIGRQTLEEFTMIVEVGEKVHIIERRYFENDVRRHFIGEVTRASERAIRLLGYVWAFDRSKGQYVMKTDIRERIIFPGERHLINILPKEPMLFEDLVSQMALRSSLRLPNSQR